MHKISKIYVANAGHKLAWYDGILLQLTDAETEQPTHTIYNLVNQGGKTTFLALFFSTFDTAKDRFLQHLSNKGQRFEQYFDDGGLPGMIVVEWQVPGDLASATKTLVTGQIVVMKKAGDTFDPDRFFFWFHGGPDLSIESIPGPNLPGGGTAELRTRGQVTDWLHTMRERYPGHFDYTTSQSEWGRMLEAEGLDVEMLRHQVDFNRKEGAMDEMFIDFKSEYDFTHRFLSLAMDTQAADDVRESVAAHCRRIEQKKPLEASSLQLEKLQGVFSGFTAAAQEYQGATGALQEAESELAVACATVQARSLERKETAAAHLRFAVAQDAAEKLQHDQMISGSQAAEALRSEQLRRGYGNARAELARADEEMASAESDIHLYQAAELLSTQELQQTKVAHLTQAIDGANTGVRPFREDLGHKAALLRQALWDAKLAKQSAISAAGAAAETIKTQLNGLSTKEASLNLAKSRALQGSATLVQQLAAAESRRKVLVEGGGLGDDELAESAHERLTAEAAGLAQQQADALARAGEHEITAKRHQDAAVPLAATKAEKTFLARQLDDRVQDAEQQYERLAHDRVLTRAIGAETADPDSEALRPALASFIQRTQGGLSEAELVLARQEEDVRSIQETGLAGWDPDVSRVIRHLADALVAGPRSHAGYLAEVLPEEAASREVALSDPARFLGVSVPNDDQLEKAREALTQPLPISRPVVVSVASNRVQHGVAAHLVAAPLDNSLYCKAAAAASLPHLEIRLIEARRSRNEVRDLLAAAHTADSALSRYQATYGNGVLDQLRQNAREAHVQAAEAELQLAQTKLDAEAARRAAKLEQETASQLLREHLARKSLADKVQEYIREHAANLADWNEQLAQGKRNLEQADFEIAGLAAERAAYEDSRREQLDIELTLKSEAQGLDAELAGVQRADKALNAKAALAERPRSLAELRSEYQTALSVLEGVEQEKTGHLVVERTAVQAALADTRRKYLAMAGDLDTHTIRSHIGADFPAAIAEAHARKKRCEVTRTATIGAHALAEEAFKTFGRTRKYPTFGIPDVEQMGDADLAAKLVEAKTNAAQAEAAEVEAGRQAKDARRSAKDAENDSQRYSDQVASLRGILPADIELPPADMTQFTDPQGLGEACGLLIGAKQRAASAVAKAHQRAEQAHDRVRALAGEESFAKVDVELAVTLRANSLDASILDYARIERAITERRAAVASELATMDHDFEQATDRLVGLVSTARSLLRRATQAMHLPDSVPMVGGLTVLRMSRALFSLSQEDLKTGLKPYMDLLAADQNVPPTGAALAAQALLNLVSGRLGIQILKMVDSVDEQYVSVDRLSHSGAERISMALLLYFVIAKLRYEERAQIRTAQGGILMLDNPFAKATARPIWQAILSLADATGIQLILTTGIKEYETLSVFKRFLRLARPEKNASTGRTHVVVADFNFRPGQAREAA